MSLMGNAGTRTEGCKQAKDRNQKQVLGRQSREGLDQPPSWSGVGQRTPHALRWSQILYIHGLVPATTQSTGQSHGPKYAHLHYKHTVHKMPSRPDKAKSNSVSHNNKEPNGQ